MPLQTLLHHEVNHAHRTLASAQPFCLLFSLLALNVGAATATQTPNQATQAEVLYPGRFPSMQFAGVYVELERGFYADVGIRVEVRPFASASINAFTCSSSPLATAFTTQPRSQRTGVVGPLFLPDPLRL